MSENYFLYIDESGSFKENKKSSFVARFVTKNILGSIAMTFEDFDQEKHNFTKNF